MIGVFRQRFACLGMIQITATAHQHKGNADGTAECSPVLSNIIDQYQALKGESLIVIPVILGQTL